MSTGRDREAPDGASEALVNVLASVPFQRAPRASEFLSYVVDETLAGRADQLSERTVGRAALGRPADFDGSQDSVVRVTATRVRKALEAYYAGDGAQDEFRIGLPPGSYVPTIERPGMPPRGAEPFPSVGVLQPEVDEGEDALVLAVSFAHALVLSLSQHEVLRVVGPAASQPDSAGWGRGTGVSHVLDGRITVTEVGLRLVGRLLSSVDGSVVWSATLDGQRDDPALPGRVEGWARELASRVAALGGVLLAETSPSTDPVLRARAAYYAYIERGTREATLDAAAALDAALALGPRAAPLLAMRGAVANNAALQAIGDPDTETELAERLAREALALDSGSAHAYLVLAGCARSRRHWSACQQYARMAARLAPHNPRFLVTAGFLIEVTGEWEEGMALVEDAFLLDPRIPVYVRLYLAMGHVVLGDYERALVEATLIDVDGLVFGPFYRALALSGLGELAAAHSEVQRLLAIQVDFFDSIEATLRSEFNFTDEQLTRLLDLLGQAQRTH